MRAEACDREGISYEKTAVGDKYVCENMMQNGHSIGGEQSGHIIFSKHATTGDGILTSLKIMEVIIEKKLPLSTLASEVKIYPQVLKNVRVYDKKEARENPEVVKVIKKVEEALGEDGRILVRESGTEPVVRVMVEASTDEICNQYVDEVIAIGANYIVGVKNVTSNEPFFQGHFPQEPVMPKCAPMEQDKSGNS